MPLNIGDDKATSGLAGAIYQAMEQHMPIEGKEKLEADTIASLQKSRQKTSFVIAMGVITHFLRDPATETEYGEVFLSPAEDAAYWDWLAGFVNVFRIWANNPAGDIVLLRTTLRNFLNANPTPGQLKGVIR
jgi:hypothetical protein